MWSNTPGYIDLVWSRNNPSNRANVRIGSMPSMSRCSSVKTKAGNNIGSHGDLVQVIIAPCNAPRKNSSSAIGVKHPTVSHNIKYSAEELHCIIASCCACLVVIQKSKAEPS